jgi:hypothetical protein
MMGRKRKQAGLVDCLLGRQIPSALGLERKIDHHDGVLLHDADQQDHADQCHDAEISVEQRQGEHRPDAGGRQGQDRERVNVALVEDAEHDVYGDDGGDDQVRFVRERLLECARGALNVPRIDDGTPSRRMVAPASRTASPSKALGARLKEIVVAMAGPW